MLIAAKNSVLHNISSLLICYVSTGSTTPTLVLKCLFFVYFLNNNYFNYNKVLDLSSYFYFQIISTPAEEDKDDGDDEGTLRAKRAKRFWSMGVVLADEDGLDGEDDGAPSRSRPPPTQTRTASKAKILELPPGHLHL